MKLDVTLTELSLTGPISTAHGTVPRRPSYVVTLRTVDAVGRGEASPWPAFGTETAEAALSVLRGFSLDVVPDSVDAIDAALGGLEATPAARAALEGALLEHLARRRGVSVAKLLSAAPAKQVRASALLTGTNLAELVAQAEAAVAQGFRTLKLKVAVAPLAVEAQRLHAVRKAVGWDVALRIDANGGWSEGTARSALRGLESLDLELCEQPVAAGDVEALRRVARAVPVPVVADEALTVAGGVERVLAEDPTPAATALVLKPAALGGLRPALRIAERAHAVGVGAIVTTFLDGPLGRAAAVHLACALPGAEHHAHGLATGHLVVSKEPDHFAPRQGSVLLNGAIGWGLEG